MAPARFRCLVAFPSVLVRPQYWSRHDEDAALLGNERSFDHDVIIAGREGRIRCVCVCVCGYVSRERATDDKQCGTGGGGATQPRRRAPATSIKVGRLDDDGRRRSHVRAQVSDALRPAAPAQGSYYRPTVNYRQSIRDNWTVMWCCSTVCPPGCFEINEKRVTNCAVFISRISYSAITYCVSVASSIRQQKWQINRFSNFVAIL